MWHSSIAHPVIAVLPLGFMMRITINGESRDFGPGLTVTALLTQLGIDNRKVAVERNLEIVPKSAFAATALQDGDRLEIVHFIGGG